MKWMQGWLQTIGVLALLTAWVPRTEAAPPVQPQPVNAKSAGQTTGEIIRYNGPSGTIELQPVGSPGGWLGFDVRLESKHASDGFSAPPMRRAAAIRFSSLGLIIAPKVVVVRSEGRITLSFPDLTTSTDCGLSLQKSQVTVSLQDGHYPETTFTLRSALFDSIRWQAVAGKNPFHFLVLNQPGAEVWHHRGWLNATPVSDPFPLFQDTHAGSPELSAYPYNRYWSTTPPLSAHPLPVIGLWSPKLGLYAGWDFQAARLTNNSERDIATGYCFRLLTTDPPTGSAPVNYQGGKAGTSGSSQALEPPRTGVPDTIRKFLGDNKGFGSEQFVALVFPFGGTGYQQLVYPPRSGFEISSKATLVVDADLTAEKDPNTLLWQSWWNQPELRDRLPRVPAVNDLSWLPGNVRLKELPGPPSGSMIVGVEKPFQIEGSRLISGWTWHNESAFLAPYRNGDKARIAELVREAEELAHAARKFKVNGETCVYWPKPLVGRWSDAWGGGPVTTLHNAGGWAAGRLLLDIGRATGNKKYLELADGVYHWTRQIVWTRNEFADVPSSPFAIGGTLAISFLLDYRASLIADPMRQSEGAQVLALARSFAYRYLSMWTADSIQSDSIDSSFLWEPNSGRDWTGAACANEVFWNLDTLGQAAVATGDPVLMWALQGSLSRWHLLYQKGRKDTLAEYASGDMTEGYGLAPGNNYGYPGGRASYGFGTGLPMLEPVAATRVRILAGAGGAMSFNKEGTHTTLSDYRCSGPGSFAVTIQTLLPEVDATITFPYSDLTGKSVSIRRNGLEKLDPEKLGKLIRSKNSLWSIIVQGLRNGDQVIIGDPDLATADKLPCAPPLIEGLESLPQTTPFQMVRLPAATSRNAFGAFSTGSLQDDTIQSLWSDPTAFSGLGGAQRWFFGVPFSLTGKSAPASDDQVVLNQTWSGVSRAYLLYAPAADNAEAAPELLNGQTTQPATDLPNETPIKRALAWKAWPELFQSRLLIAEVPLGPDAKITGVRLHGTRLFGLTTLSGDDAGRSAGIAAHNLLDNGYRAWQQLSSEENIIQELQKVASTVPEGRLGMMLPEVGASAADSLLISSGLRRKMVVMGPEQLMDPKKLDASKLPFLVYVGGEEYQPTFKTANDTVGALTHWLQQGGTLVVMAGMPYPLFYAQGTGGADPLLPKLGAPISNAIEQLPAQIPTVKLAKDQRILHDLPADFNYPAGDPRLRVVEHKAVSGVTYTTIYQVVGSDGKSYGDAACLVELPESADKRRGRILYISNVLSRDPQAGPQILRAVIHWMADEITKK